jgi:hypothetical protein
MIPTPAVAPKAFELACALVKLVVVSHSVQLYLHQTQTG